MINLPIEYTKDVFFQYAGYPEKTSTGFRASCPVCMEGKSWGKKKRLYYFPEQNYFYCQNDCGSFSDYFWVKTVTGKTFSEIREEMESGGFSTDEFNYYNVKLEDDKELFQFPPLPKDAINLFDKTQVLYFKDNYWVKTAINFMVARGILKAPYKPKSLFISLTDSVHRNRLTIPFYDDDSNIEFYQSRALTPYQQKMSKFLSKMNSEKSIFNLNKLDLSSDYIFIMEGAIDSMFLKNSVAISGVYMTDHQQDLIQVNAPLHKKVWIYDNYKLDAAGRSKMLDKIMDGSTDLFFDWSDSFSNYKDLNDFCINENIWDINPDEIIKRSVSGPKLLLRL